MHNIRTPWSFSLPYIDRHITYVVNITRISGPMIEERGWLLLVPGFCLLQCSLYAQSMIVWVSWMEPFVCVSQATANHRPPVQHWHCHWQHWQGQYYNNMGLWKLKIDHQSIARSIHVSACIWYHFTAAELHVNSTHVQTYTYTHTHTHTHTHMHTCT